MEYRSCQVAAPIVGADVPIGTNRRTFTARFDLTSTAPATCDVAVISPDRTSATLPQGFSVHQGGAPVIRISKVATGAVPGLNMTYWVTVQNVGTIDADNLTVEETLQPWFTFLSSTLAPGSVSYSPTVWPPSAVGGGTQYAAVVQWTVPVVFAGSSTTFQYTVRLDSEVAGHSTVNGPACVSRQGLALAGCMATFVACVEVGDVGCASVPGPQEFLCLGAVHTICEGAAARCIEASAQLQGSLCIDYPSFTHVSGDPNSLVGPEGKNSQNWLSGQANLPYLIEFSNLPNATAPAQKVDVTAPIDPNIDVSTLQLLGIALVGQQVPIPSTFKPNIGLDGIATNLDLRPSQNLLVNVSAVFDPNANAITWTLTSIDPATGLPPTDATIGFLPPGAEASLVFSGLPRKNLVTGAQISETASVVFDVNAPMSTPPWLNTIDNTPPTSQVAILPVTSPAAGFTVNWSGTDVGSGIQDFTIYVSDNGGPFTAWLTNTTAMSASFTGQLGHSYSFYSIARDLVGNIESPKTTAEATTLVSNTADLIPPITTATLSVNPNANGWNNSNLRVSLSATDNEPGGSGVKEIHYTMSGAQSGGNVLLGSTATLTVSSEGITTITYFSVDNAGNFEAAKSITIKLDKTPPTILGSRTPAPNTNGWNNTPVTVSFQCSDALSGLAAGSPPAPTVLSTEGAGQSVNGTCTDLAGNLATANVPGINIDLTPPKLTATLNPLANAKGWNRTNVLVTWTAVDALSGVATVSAPVTVTTEGAGQVVAGNATDLAGNLATGSVRVNVDKTPPEAYLQFDSASRDVVLYGRDSLSGVVPGPVPPISVQPLHDRDEGNHMGDRSHEREVSQRDEDSHREEIRMYQVFDLAGNSLLLSVEVRKEEHRIDATVLNVQYNGGSVLTMPRNEETFNWESEKVGNLEELYQTLTVSAGKNSQRWSAEYESRRNSTTIEREAPKPEQRSVQPGLVLLQMSTAGGKLSIGF